MRAVGYRATQEDDDALRAAVTSQGFGTMMLTTVSCHETRCLAS